MSAPVPVASARVPGHDHPAPRGADLDGFLFRYRQLTIGTAAIAGSFVLIGVLVAAIAGSLAGLLPAAGGLLTLVLLGLVVRHIAQARAAIESGAVSDLVLSAEIRGGFMRRYRSELALPGETTAFVHARTLYTQPIMAQTRGLPVTVHGPLTRGSVFVAVGDGLALVGRISRLRDAG